MCSLYMYTSFICVHYICTPLSYDVFIIYVHLFPMCSLYMYISFLSVHYICTPPIQLHAKPTSHLNTLYPSKISLKHCATLNIYQQTVLFLRARSFVFSCISYNQKNSDNLIFFITSRQGSDSDWTISSPCHSLPNRFTNTKLWNRKCRVQIMEKRRGLNDSFIWFVYMIFYNFIFNITAQHKLTLYVLGFGLLPWIISSLAESHIILQIWIYYLYFIEY